MSGPPPDVPPDAGRSGDAAPLSLGWFSTGRGEGSRGLLQTVLDAIHRGELDARVQFVFCNRDPGEQPGSDEFMALVRSHGIPLVTLSSQRLRRQRKARTFAEVRELFDRQVMALLAQYQPDVCILGGYMLFTAPEMVERYTMLNLHPALPGGTVGTWQEVIWQVIADRAAEHGATVQVATDDWDKGPTASYVSFPVRGGDFDALWAAVEGRDVAATSGPSTARRSPSSSASDRRASAASAPCFSRPSRPSPKDASASSTATSWTPPARPSPASASTRRSNGPWPAPPPDLPTPSAGGFDLSGMVCAQFSVRPVPGGTRRSLGLRRDGQVDKGR